MREPKGKTPSWKTRRAAIIGDGSLQEFCALPEEPAIAKAAGSW